MVFIVLINISYLMSFVNNEFQIPYFIIYIYFSISDSIVWDTVHIDLISQTWS